METIKIECPFCNKPIKVFYRPAIRRELKKTSWGGSKKAFTIDKESMILPDKCPYCGKTKKEIEKRLKEGKVLSREEIIKRAKEAGLPLKIKG